VNRVGHSAGLLSYFQVLNALKNHLEENILDTAYQFLQISAGNTESQEFQRSFLLKETGNRDIEDEFQ
jgi:hypothetical protein